MDSATLNSRLEYFSKKLKPSDGKIGNETAERIFKLLKNSSLFKVDRVNISGSVGKYSAISVDPDYELVVFVNDQKPYFEEALNNFKRILKNTDMRIKNIEVKGIACYLFVCLVLVQSPRFAMGNLPNQNPFVHDVVRLAKFWNKTLNMGTNISGRSTLIELIGIYAAKIQEARDQKSCLVGFKTFLQFMTNFDRTCVIFCFSYHVREIPSDVRKQRPLVLDPVNPYNNFAYFHDDVKTGIIDKYQQFARATLDRLNNFTGMDHLFQVQPKVFVPGPQPRKWLLGLEPNYLNLVNPKIEVRVNDEEFKLKAGGIRDMQQCFLTTLAALTLDWRWVGDKEAERRIKSCVDINICGLEVRYWKEANDGPRHEDYNITFSIPIPVNQHMCIVVSGSW